MLAISVLFSPSAPWWIVLPAPTLVRRCPRRVVSRGSIVRVRLFHTSFPRGRLSPRHREVDTSRLRRLCLLTITITIALPLRLLLLLYRGRHRHRLWDAVHHLAHRILGRVEVVPAEIFAETFLLVVLLCLGPTALDESAEPKAADAPDVSDTALSPSTCGSTAETGEPKKDGPDEPDPESSKSREARKGKEAGWRGRKEGKKRTRA
jgi:hypothetical protein